MRFVVAQIPHEPVQARFHLKLLLGFLLVGIERFLERRHFRTRILADHLARTVKDFELINPHGWLRVMVSNANGVQSEWPVEMGGAGQLARFGWTQDAVHPGDKVTVQLHPLRDGSYGGQLVSVTLPNGKVLGQRPPGA